jgi:dihydrofolate synthase/folylpolyglutamate synthase
MSAYEPIITRLLALHPKRIDLSLDRIRRILDKLDHPEKKIPPVIHVAGTNGKGSTVAFMRAVLEAAGRSVHVYTSPHLVRFNERFRIGARNPKETGGALVGDEALVDVLEECERANGGEPITVFEIETAAAFLLFSRHPADVTLLEVGLGGRLDATNVIETPLACAITPVSMDHLEFLGDSIEKIAAEKAAILKRNVPAAIAPQAGAVLTVIEQEARRVRAPLRVAGEHWSVHGEHGRLVYQDDDGLLDCALPKLSGRHQVENAGLAIATLRAAGFALPLAAFEVGIAKAEWPARMQRLTQGRLKALTPPDSELWLDGGHNADGGRAVAAALGDIEERVPRPLVLIVGMLATKDNAGFLRNFSGLARRVIAVPVPRQDKSVAADALVDMARSVGIPAESRDSIEAALAAVARLELVPAPRILITGSLYLAGEVLAQNGTPPV